MIHPTAIIDAQAKLAADVEVGPYSIIGPNVEIGVGTKIGPHVVIQGPCKVGQNNRIFQFASVGEMPQDLKYHGEDSVLEIGDHNTIREFATLQRGTLAGGNITKIGDHNLFMNYTHVAHDCIVGDYTIFSNNASLAGHVFVEDHVILGGFAGVAQFLRVGAHSFVCTNTVVNKDVLPYTLVSGYYASPFGLNTVGLRRRGFGEETLENLNKAYKIIYRQGLTVEQAVEALQAQFADVPEVKAMIRIMLNSKHGIVR